MSQEIRGERQYPSIEDGVKAMLDRPRILSTAERDLQLVQGFGGYSAQSIANQISSTLKALNVEGRYSYLVKNISMTSLSDKQMIYAVVVFEEMGQN